MAYQFFAACSFFTHHSAKDAFTYFYTKWPHFPFLGAKCMYYNLHEGRFKHLDETYVEEFDDVTPSFGFLAKGFPSTARNILIQTNQKKYAEGDV